MPINATAKSLTDLSQILEVVDKQTQGFAKNIANAGQESKKWTFVARVLSGSGLWRLQARLRAVAQAFDFYFKAQENAMKLQAENIEGLAQLEAAQKGIAFNLKTLDKLEKGGISNLGKKHKKNEMIISQFKLLKKNMKEARKEMGLSTKDSILNEAVTKRLAKSYETLDKKLKKLAKDRVKEMKISLAKEQKLILWERQEKLKAAKEELKILQDMNAEEIRIREIVLGKVGEHAKEKKRIEGKVLGLTTQQTRAKEKIGGFGGFKKEFMKGFGNPIKDIKEKFTKWKDAYNKGEGIKKKLSKISFGALSKVGKVMGMALKFSLYFILFIMGAFLIFSIIRKIFSNAEMMATLMETFKGIFEGLKVILSGFMLIFSAFFGSGTFGERLQMLLKGVYKIFGGTIKILASILGGLLKIVIGLVLGIVKTIKDAVWSFVGGIKDWIVEKWGKLMQWFSNLPSSISGKMTAIKDKLWEQVVALWDGLYDTLIQPVLNLIQPLLDALNDVKDFVMDFEMFASGGVSKGGLAMVGERGPELVNLPAGSRVTPTPQTKRMLGGTSNTVNVSVNGRVGASDSELRDIAKKIGRMVSAEINRSTSSSTNVRY